MSEIIKRHGNRSELLGNGKILGKNFTLEDISSSGCRIRILEELAVGETYDMSLEIFGHPGMKRHVELRAHLVRFITRSELVGNEYAFEFVGLSEWARIDLDELINVTGSKATERTEHKLTAHHNIGKE